MAENNHTHQRKVFCKVTYRSLFPERYFGLLNNFLRTLVLFLEIALKIKG